MIQSIVNFLTQYEYIMSIVNLHINQVRKLVEDVFIRKMPFNHELGLELIKYEDHLVQLKFINQNKLIGNIDQRILHGGVIASALDVAAGVVCITNSLIKKKNLSEIDLRQKLSYMVTINIRVDYLKPARGQYFIVDSKLLHGGNKISVAIAKLYDDCNQNLAIATVSYMV